MSFVASEAGRLALSGMRATYARDGIVQIVLPSEPRLPNGETIKRITDEIINSDPDNERVTKTLNKTNEKIRVQKRSGPDADSAMVVEERSVLTRMENFVSLHKEWEALCGTGGVLSEIVGHVCTSELQPQQPSEPDARFNDSDSDSDGEQVADSEPWCLYKEKLNLKPAGGMGFAPVCLHSSF